MNNLEQVEFLMEGAVGTALNIDMTLCQVELLTRRKTVLRALAVEHWNISRSARRLGVHRNTMTRIMQEMDIRRAR